MNNSFLKSCDSICQRKCCSIRGDGKPEEHLELEGVDFVIMTFPIIERAFNNPSVATIRPVSCESVSGGTSSTETTGK